MAYWLLKSEPSAYAWAHLLRDGRTRWDGVRNYQARNNLRAMAEGDLGFFYHSVDERQIVGVMRVVKTAYPDPTAPGEDWSVVDLVPVQALVTPVTLAQIKAHPKLQNLALLKQSRLSVSPVAKAEWDILCALGQISRVK